MHLISLDRSVYPQNYQTQRLAQTYRPSVAQSYQQPSYQVPYQQQLVQPSYSAYLASSVKPMTAQPRVKQVDKYTMYLDYQVGSGASSVVYRGRNTLTGEEVCVKYVDCLQLQPGQKNMVLREAQFLTQLKHPNILKCTEVLDSGSSLYIICEYCEQGDLYEKILKEGPMSEELATRMMKGISSALCTLKKYGIIHRDIKPSNVLLKDGVPKLADFGFAISEM